MDIPSSDDIHRLTVQEFDTTKLMAHAARQARQRKYSEFMIVDIDSHHYESDHLSEIYEYIEAPVIKQLGQSFSKTMGLPMFPQRGNDQEMGGRIMRSALRRMACNPRPAIATIRCRRCSSSAAPCGCASRTWSRRRRS